MARRIVCAVLATVFGIAGFVVGAGGVASGGEISYGGSMVADPTTVEPGEIITVSNAEGSECLGPIVIGQFTARPGAWSTAPDASGDWSVELEVPPNGMPDAMGNPTPFPPGEYDIFARCEATCPEGWESQCGGATAESNGAQAGAIRPAQSAESFEYEPVAVEVVAQTDGPTTTGGGTATTAPSDDTTPTTAGGAVQDAGAAAPVQALPTFTG